MELPSLQLQSLNKIFIVACGTAMHAGLSGKNTIEKLCRIPVEVDIASEFRYRDPLVNDKTLCIFITQSVETADTIAALKLAKEKEFKSIITTNGTLLKERGSEILNAGVHKINVSLHSQENGSESEHVKYLLEIAEFPV